MKSKILNVIPDAKESADHIVDAYILLKFKNVQLEAFVPRWMQYFPYHPKPSKWGVGQQLIDNLIGKSVDVELKFIDLKTFQKTSEMKKSIFQENGSSANTTIVGKIIDKKEYCPADYSHKQLCPDPNKFEKIIVDCGLKINAGVKKGLFNIGDFVIGRGVMQADLIKIQGEKLNEF